ncbi:TM2 domain-containing protein [Bartonella raoultii]|uniref:TM2 domain-containing protein n=1 Tax=Bartonella raoultii TaxID=1457020 RepID=UPI001ABB3A96|nr:TM2 domain-containing protein [Bartonella raoultii]
MKGKIIGQDQGDYFISGADGKRYQFANWDWSGKKPPKVGDVVDFVCEGDTVKSIFPILTEGQSSQSKVTLAIVCLFLGGLGIHRFMVGKTGTGVVMLLLTITLVGAIISGFWAFIDFIVILTGNFRDKDGHKITG